MAYDAEKKLLVAKIETTEGTDSTPGATDAIVTRNLQFGQIQAQRRVRNIDGQYFGARPGFYNNFIRPVTWECELSGSGTATTPPGWMKLLRACGFDAGVVGASEVVQSPISAAVPTITLGDYHDNLLMKALGARGTASLTIEDDDIPYISFAMQGIPPSGLISEASPPTPTFAAQAVGVIASTAETSFELDGYAAPLRRLTIDFGVNVELRSLIGPSDTMAFRNRAITGTAVIELPDLGDQDYFGLINTASAVLEVVHGTDAGNIVEIDAPTVEIGVPQLSEEQGKVMASVPLVFVPSTSGNDEITLTTK